MISASNTLQNILKQNSSVTIDSGCTIEYNMNDMVNNLSVIVKDISTGSLLGDNVYENIDGYRPFKNFFPYESVALSNRPEYAGIRYGIFGDIAAQTYTDPQNLKYQISGNTLTYRTYYPGIENQYKYFIMKKGTGVRIAVEYSKTILTNKIVVKFETSHCIPQSGNIKTTTVVPDGTYTSILSFTSANISNSGVMTLYYNGSSWSFNESSLNASSSISVRGVELQVSGVSNKYIGVIEISPRWVIDISSDTLSIDISKEASMDQEVVPVGIVSANSLSLSINRYNNSDLKILSYNKSSTAFASDKLYLYKDAEIKPFFKIYYTGAPLSDSKGAYEKVPQGTYYMDSWNVDEFGGASITALDGAKKLQQTFCPDILCKEFSSGAIIRRLLDSIGFTNYNINTASDANENSVITPKYWWTESNKTIWQAIQEICKDNQMVATFDENNTLQFYTRDFLYDDARSANWPLNYASSGSDLPNIASLDKKELRNGNNIVVRWSAVESTESSLEGAPLWTAPTSWLGAMALAENISDTQTGVVKMNPITRVTDVNQELLYSLTGYLLIDSEIIEYDGIEYQYSNIEKPLAEEDWEEVIIKNPSDIKKYISKAFKPTYQYFRPSGRINIKTRGAFNTQKVPHEAAKDNGLSGWKVQTVRWA